MRGMIRVRWQDMGLLIAPEVAEQFGLYEGAVIVGDARFWEVLWAHCEQLKAECELGIAMIENFDLEVRDEKIENETNRVGSR